MTSMSEVEDHTPFTPTVHRASPDKPIPKRKPPTFYPFKTMEIGDYFDLPKPPTSDDMQALRCRVHAAAARRGMKATVRTLPKIVRVWRRT